MSEEEGWGWAGPSNPQRVGPEYEPTDWWWHDPIGGGTSGFVCGRPCGDGTCWRVYRIVRRELWHDKEQHRGGSLNLLRTPLEITPDDDDEEMT